jgi:hypothetical protein
MPLSPEFHAHPVWKRARIVAAATVEWAWDWVRYATAVGCFRAGVWLCPKGWLARRIGWQCVGVALVIGRDFRASPDGSTDAPLP